MKYLIIIAILALCNKSFGQSDTIVKRSGEKLAVTIKSNDPSSVTFVYPNEDLINTLNKNVIEKIIFKSGRIEVCSQATKLEVVNGIEDWEKVIITNNPADVEGLTKVGEVSSKSAWGGSLGQNLADKIAREKLKKDAAEMKASIVLLETYKNGYYGTKINGVAYK
jgi:hypothetical protein